MSFLEENAKKDDVVTTESGLQYKVLKSGEGNSPLKTDTVSVHYEGRLTDGTVFDSSIERDQPADFAVNAVIAGWTEALQLMKEGDEWELYVPSDLAYGKVGAGSKIGPDETLIFKTNLLSIKTYAPLKIEERAVEEIKRVLTEQDMPLETHALKVGVEGGGCSGFSYALGFIKAEDIGEEDVEIEIEGLRVVVDHRSQPYLAGTEIGFQDGLQGRGFLFNNPMATGGSCGCGTSFSVKENSGGGSGGCGSGGCGSGCG